MLAGVSPLAEYLLEANVRLLEASRRHGRYGVFLDHATGGRTSLTLAADGSGLLCEVERDAQRPERRLGAGRAIQPRFKADAYHQLLVKVREGEVEVRLDGARVAAGIETPPAAGYVGLLTRDSSAAFDGVSVTPL
jgi:hypothetical protein